MSTRVGIPATGSAPDEDWCYGTSLAQVKGVISSKTLVVSLVGAGCMTAAGLGGYLAVKSGSTSSWAAPGTPPAVQTAQVAEDTTGRPVQATDVSALPLAAQPPDRTAPTPKPSRRVDATETTRKPEAVPAARPEPERVVPRPDPTTEPIPAEIPPTAAPAEESPRSSPPISEVTAVGPVDPPKPAMEEVTVNADAVIGIRLSAPVSSDTARIEDRVVARVTRDVVVDGRTAVPAGSLVEGSVTTVERGGRFKERARIGVRFTTVVLADNAKYPIQTETIFRTGEEPTGQAASKIGAGAVMGAIIGAVIGGKKGAAIGTGAGAAGGTAAVMAAKQSEAVIPGGTPLTVRLTEPVTVLVDRER